MANNDINYELRREDYDNTPTFAGNYQLLCFRRYNQSLALLVQNIFGT